MAGGVDHPCIYRGCFPNSNSCVISVAVVSRKKSGHKSIQSTIEIQFSPRNCLEAPAPSLEPRNDLDTVSVLSPLGAVVQQGQCDSTCCLSRHVERSSIVNASMLQLHPKRACLTRGPHGLRIFGQAGRRRNQAGRGRLLIMATKR